MPCTLSPEEARWYEKEANKKNFEFDGTNIALTTEVACQACRALQKAGLITKQSSLLQTWWKKHKEWDASQGRNHDD